MKRMKTASCILLLTIMMMVLCGCSILSQDAEEYTTAAVVKIVEDALYSGEQKCTAEFSSSSVSPSDLERDLKNALQSNYLFSCMLEDIVTYAEKKLFRTRVTFRLHYSDNAKESGAVLNVSGEAQLRETLAHVMEKNAAKTPLLIRNYEFSEESIRDLLSEADINCDEAAYEYENMFYAFYEKDNDRRLVIVWGEPPVSYPELIEKKAELAVNVSYYVEAAKRLQPANNIEKYKAVYDLLCKTVSYDYTLADASLTDPGDLPPEMLRQRTAYGALITRSTVCSGYARAFKSICDELNLPCYIVTGYCEGVRHAWNVVPIDGRQYYIDCTSGDEGGFGDALFLFTEAEAQYYGYLQDEHCHIPF